MGDSLIENGDVVPDHVGLQFSDLQGDHFHLVLVACKPGLFLFQSVLSFVHFDHIVLRGDEAEMQHFEAKEKELGDGAELFL